MKNYSKVQNSTLFKIAQKLEWSILIYLSLQNAAEITISKKNWLPCKMRKIFKGRLLYWQKFPHGEILWNYWNFIRNLKIYYKNRWSFHKNFCKSDFKVGKVKFPKMTRYQFQQPTYCKENGLLRKKCPYSELYWSAFSRIWTEYGEIRSICPYSVQMEKIQTRITPNTDTFYAVVT